jgi:hypothetical protein
MPPAQAGAPPAEGNISRDSRTKTQPWVHYRVRHQCSVARTDARAQCKRAHLIGHVAGGIASVGREFVELIHDLESATAGALV